MDTAVRILLVDEKHIKFRERVGIQCVCVHPAITIGENLTAVFVYKAPFVVVFLSNSNLSVGILVILLQIAVAGRFNDAVKAIAGIPIARVDLLVNGYCFKSAQDSRRIIGITLRWLYMLGKRLSFLPLKFPDHLIECGLNFRVRIVLEVLAQLIYRLFLYLESLRNGLVYLLLTYLFHQCEVLAKQFLILLHCLISKQHILDWGFSWISAFVCDKRQLGYIEPSRRLRLVLSPGYDARRQCK